MGTEKKGMMTVLELKIDPEFQGKIPPLTEAEFKQLEENILTAGEVYEPIAVWNGTIVDGHNRYKIIQDHPEIRWRTREMQFDDKWAAFDWMYKNQLGRRNLTDEQRMYILGKMYEARKNTHGGERGNQYVKLPSSQIGNLPQRISDQIAQEQHVAKNTVIRAERFSKGIEAIQEVEPELADSILKAETKIPKSTIQDIGQAKPEARSEMIQAVKGGVKSFQTPEEKKKPSKEERQKHREEMKAIKEIKDELFDHTRQVEYTVSTLINDIQINASPFVGLFRQIAERHKTICAYNKGAVVKALHENIVLKIEELEKEIENYAV